MVLNIIRNIAFSSLSPAFSKKKLPPDRGSKFTKQTSNQFQGLWRNFNGPNKNKNISRPEEIGGSGRVRTNASSQLGTAIGESRNPCTENNQVKYIMKTVNS
jgi:hypothetical protein